MALYRRKVPVIEANQWHPGVPMEGVLRENEDECVTPQGLIYQPRFYVLAGLMQTTRLYLESGYWIMKDQRGTVIQIMAHETFVELYELVD